MRIIYSFVLACAVSLGYAQSSLSKVDSRMMINVDNCRSKGGEHFQTKERSKSNYQIYHLPRLKKMIMVLANGL